MSDDSLVLIIYAMIGILGPLLIIMCVAIIFLSNKIDRFEHPISIDIIIQDLMKINTRLRKVEKGITQAEISHARLKERLLQQEENNQCKTSLR